MFYEYIKILRKIIKLSLELSSLNDAEKLKIEFKISHQYFIQVFNRVEDSLLPDHKSELNSIISQDGNIELKINKIEKIMDTDVSKELYSQILLDELENITKSIIRITAGSLDSDTKKGYLALIHSWLTEQ